MIENERQRMVTELQISVLRKQIYDLIPTHNGQLAAASAFGVIRDLTRQVKAWDMRQEAGTQADKVLSHLRKLKGFEEWWGSVELEIQDDIQGALAQIIGSVDTPS